MSVWDEFLAGPKLQKRKNELNQMKEQFLNRQGSGKGDWSRADSECASLCNDPPPPPGGTGSNNRNDKTFSTCSLTTSKSGGAKNQQKTVAVASRRLAPGASPLKRAPAAESVEPPDTKTVTLKLVGEERNGSRGARRAESNGRGGADLGG